MIICSFCSIILPFVHTSKVIKDVSKVSVVSEQDISLVFSLKADVVAYNFTKKVH